MKNLFNPPLFVDLQLLRCDGREFALMSAFEQQAIKEGWSSEDIQTVLSECISGDYVHLVATLNEHCAPGESDDYLYEG